MSNPPTDMDVAVVGCGYWGPNLIRNLHTLNRCRRIVACDTSPRQLERVQSLYPHVFATDRYESVLADERICAVVICTPVKTHHDLARAALLAGKHVLIEKPMAASFEQCEGLSNLAEERGRVLMVGHTFEYSPAVNKVREIIGSGELGSLVYLSFNWLNLGPYRPDINVVWDLAPHQVSILIHLLGRHPVAVNAHGRAHYRESIADVASAALRFDTGEVAFLNVSWVDPCKTRRVTVVGTRKMLVLDDVEINEKVKIYDKGIDFPPHYDTFADFHFSYRYGDIHIPRIEDQEPLKLECHHFLECIEQGSRPRSDGRSGGRVVALLEAICESMGHNGAQVRIRREVKARRPATRERPRARLSSRATGQVP
jgi:predicted dehydrogenase